MKQTKLAITTNRLKINLVASIIVVRSKISKYNSSKRTIAIAKMRSSQNLT